jgi:succinate dehydrogenase/fumarate reductase flavoprotein subunit
MGTFYGHLVPHPLRKFEPMDFLPLAQYYSIWTILLNAQGERFADEHRSDEALNQDLTKQRGDFGVMIFDSRVRALAAASEPFQGFGIVDRLALATAGGAKHTRADSLDELVDHVATWGLDPATTKSSVEDYVSAIEEGRRESRGVPVSPEARAPQEPPFYALQVRPSITFTFGGIRIDASGHVLNSSATPIPGVFAAGADTGGISHYGYVGGLAPAYVTGRWAGSAAAARALGNDPDGSAC